jgi:transposase
MGRRGYPAEFRQRVLDLVAAGRGVEDVARDLGISDQTIYSWRHQDRIDHGLEAGHGQQQRCRKKSCREPTEHCGAAQVTAVVGIPAP